MMYPLLGARNVPKCPIKIAGIFSILKFCLLIVVSSDILYICIIIPF